jgi:transposase
MWRFSKTNGITEGFHNKMEMISRRAYGFRNFENYRLRVLTHWEKFLRCIHRCCG